MTAPTTTPTSSCPSWCDDPHTVTTPAYRAHARRATLREGVAFARLNWDEPLTPAARHLDAGPLITFGTELAAPRMVLKVGQARALAAVMSGLGQTGAASLLRRAVALAEGGDSTSPASELHADTAQDLATVTEYGVKAYSKYHGEHHVDACGDLESALSTLRTTRKRIDAWAHLVSREVPAPGPVGEWRAVSPDDAAAALETARAVAQ